MTYKSKSNTVRGLVLGVIQKFLNDARKGITYTPQELEMVFSEMLRKFNEFYPKKIVKNEIKIIQGWKGEGTTEVYEGFENDFIIIEYIKDKHSGEVDERRIEIPKENVNRIIFIIKKMKIGEKMKCYEVVEKMGYDWKNDVWKNRTKVYFAEYYYPIKICESLKIIKYGGRGSVERLI